MITRLGLVAAALIAGCASALAQVPSGPGATSFSQISGQVSPSQLPAATTVNLGAVTYGTAAGTAAQGNDSRITGACQTSGCTFTGPVGMGANQLSGSNVAITGGAINGTPIGATTPSTIAATTLNASGNDALLYYNSAGQSIPNNAATTVTGWTKISDRVNANFNASTGVFTAPATGIYQVGGQITYAAVSATAGIDFTANVIANGTAVAQGQVAVETASSQTVSVPIPMTDVSLIAGQTIVIQAYQNAGSAVSLLNYGVFNTLSINRLP
jgi:hypothetical protein